MCLQWQFDIRRGNERPSKHYYEKYHVGKYPKSYFDDLADSVVDREYVINKMNIISEARMKRDRNLGINSNKVVIKQSEIPSEKTKNRVTGIRISDDTILKRVPKAEQDLSNASLTDLRLELMKRDANSGKTAYNDKLTEKRHKYNLECIRKLIELTEKYPQWRFTQLLFNVGLAEDRFYEEPEQTLKTLNQVNF